MSREEAEHISLIAAPLYAVLVGQARLEAVSAAGNVPVEKLSKARRIAIEQAHALWLDTLDYGAS